MHHLKPGDYLAVLGVGGGAAVGWTLNTINAALTTVSLVLGISFLLWRWWREAKGKSDE